MTRPPYTYAASLIRAIDGDTFEMDLDLGFSAHVHARVRLLDWSCPELREPLGQDARMVAEALLAKAGRILVSTEKDAQTFARWLCRIWIDGKELGQVLADNGLAVRTVRP